MKVGIICPYDWSYPGGVRTHILGQARALSSRGIEAEIIAPSARPDSGVFVVGKGVPIPANRSIARICFSHSAKKRVEERLERGDIQLLHLHEPLIPSVSLLALMGSELPVVATFHASRERSLGYALGSQVLGKWAEKIGERIVVSEAARSLVGQYFPGQFELIPNGVDLTRYRGAEPDPEILSLKPFVLFVGRPEARKGFGVMMRAMKSVRKSVDVNLVVVGSERKHSPKWVTGLGRVEQERLPGIYAAADLFCAPSLGGESFGIVLVEAMAAGTPVVASDIPGYREAAGGAGLLVPAGDGERLGERITDVLSEEGLAREMADKGKRRAAQLDWDLLSERLMEVYRRAMMSPN